MEFWKPPHATVPLLNSRAQVGTGYDQLTGAVLYGHNDQPVLLLCFSEPCNRLTDSLWTRRDCTHIWV